MKKTLLSLLFSLLVPLSLLATHIVGGSLTYEHMGGSTYRITMKLYRDCDGIGFPGSVRIEVRQPNGSSFSPDKDIVIPFNSSNVLNPPIDTCAFNPGVCVEEAIFTKIVNHLPPNPGGYHLFYDLCCRNNSITNVNNPGGAGESFYTYIPDNSTWLTNSSPDWVNFPPVFICQNQLLQFDHSATDADGDSLVYSLYTPYDDDPPTFPGNQATFTPITWNAGYSATNPMGGGVFSLNPQTGILSVNPPNQGQYVVGVMVEEYRNGTKIGEVLRDFQFNVLNCPPVASADIGDLNGCDGNAVQMVNSSSSTANNFFWDFGDTTTLADTSHQYQPSYTYPGLGTYVVMLIAQYNTPCADTTYDTLTISYVNAGFTAPDSACSQVSLNFNDTSQSAPGSTINQWYWDFGDSSNANIPSPSHSYASGSTYTVTLVATSDEGCSDTATKSIYIQERPTAYAPDTFACKNNPVVNMAGNVNNAGGGLWVGPGTFNPNTTTLNASYTPTSSDTAQGYAQVILTTTGNGFCPSASDTVIITYTEDPTISIGPDIAVCSDSTGIPLSYSVTVAAGAQWGTTGSGSFSPNNLDSVPIYNPSSADTAGGSILIYATSIGNSTCDTVTDTLTMTFTPTPKISVTVPDTACAGTQLIPLNANSTTNNGVWQSSGTGNFIPDDSLLTTGYVASAADNNAGQVTFYFTSTQNGGCRPQKDSVDVTLIPPPVAGYSYTKVCPRDTVVFTDTSSSVEPIVSWEWDFGDNDTSTLQHPSHVYDTSGFYSATLVVTSNNGCTDTLSRSVEIYPFPDSDFRYSGVCQDVETEFRDTSSVDYGSVVAWDWTFGDGTPGSNEENPVHTYDESGSYNVYLIATSDQGCTDTVWYTIDVQPPPTADFEKDKESVIIFENYQFTDLSFDDIDSWLWDFGDTSGTSTDQHPQYNYGASGTYNVCLEVTDVYGCRDTVCKDVIVFMPPKVPSAFSPNGDGRNDELKVLGGPYIDLEFNVYNNWGQLIFSSANQADGWDGTYKGEDQPIGVYVYTVNAVTQDNEKHQLKGDVTLLR